MIYLDNAATTFPKPESVIRATEDCITKYCANSGRSAHSLAIKTSEEIYYTREVISNFLSYDAPENVCFTTNATYALNIAIKSYITEKCHVIISDVEHNSVLRPINKLKSTLGVDYSCFSTDGNIESNITKIIRKDTKAIICTLMSNVTGAEIPLEILSRTAKKHNLLLIVDASQIIGHKKIDLGINACDALCAPAHKGLFGIQGAGFIIFGKNPPNYTLIEGGSGNESRNLFMPSDLPEHFEAGTLPTPSIVALRAGIEYINSKGISIIEEEIESLTSIFCERLSTIKSIKVYPSKNGIISFETLNINSYAVSSLLNDKSICVRGGLHCAPMAHAKLGTIKNGLVRVSISVFNTEKDADLLCRALREITS